MTMLVPGQYHTSEISARVLPPVDVVVAGGGTAGVTAALAAARAGANTLLVGDRGMLTSAQIEKLRTLEATERWLAKVAGDVARRTAKPLSAADIGQKVDRGINRYKVAKHFALEIADSHLCWSRKQDSITREKALDGVYIIRTPEPVETLSAEDAVRAYKQLGDVEKAFRTHQREAFRLLGVKVP